MAKCEGCSTLIASFCLMICAALAIVALFPLWWEEQGDSSGFISYYPYGKFGLWTVDFGHYGVTELHMSSSMDDFCHGAFGGLDSFCSKIRALRAVTMLVVLFGIAHAILLLCAFCRPQMWLHVTGLTIGAITLLSSICAIALGFSVASGLDIPSSAGPTPKAGMIFIVFATLFSLIGYILSTIGVCFGPKGSGRCCCDSETGAGGFVPGYAGHQRFQNRPPVGGAPVAGRPPVAGMRPPMSPPQMTPYSVQPPVYNSQLPPAPYSQRPSPVGHHFGIDRRQ